MATAANGGQILITAATRRAVGDEIQVRDLGPHRLKDFPQPEPLYRVVVEGAADEAVPAPRSASVRPTNLPPQTRRLIGRERERGMFAGLLKADGGSIVTLTGIGGTGKTRLAVAIGSELLDEFPGGMFLVRLAGVSDPSSIVPMIAEAVRVTGPSNRPLVDALGSAR